MLKRITAMLLCVAMVVSMVPGQVFAGELEETLPTEAVSSESEASETEETSGTTVPTEPTEEVPATEETVPETEAVEKIIIRETVYVDHLQQLPENICAGTNLWTAADVC